MNLPLITTPTFTDIIPSTKMEVKFRPFLVKEEKILLMALEGGEKKDVVAAIQQIFASCIKTENFDIRKLASFDFEYLMLKIRAKSVGETIELNFRHDEDDCGHVNTVKFNIDDVKVHFDESHTNKIMIDDNVGIMMKYPDVYGVDDFDIQDESVESIIRIFAACVDYVFDAKETYTDYSKDELIQFIENLNQGQFEKITQFFQTMPKLKHDIKFTCEKCGKEVTTEVEGLQSFFI